MERGQETLLSRGFFPVSSADARNELDRILSDPEFHCAERNKKFLRFISEEFFAGRAGALKAYAIAVDVFGRPQSFDASTDPIVRIEATRLRAALIRYYETNSSGEDIEIRLPKGHYVPEFVRVPARPTKPTEDDKADVAPVLHFTHRVRALLLHAPQKQALVAVMALAVIAMLGTLLAVTHERVNITDRPTVSLELITSDEGTQATAFRDQLMIALSRFNTLRLSSDVYTASSGDRLAQEDTARSRYQIVLKYDIDAARSSAWWQLIDRDSGETVRAGEESVPVDELSPNEAEEQLTSKLSVRLASMRGVINSIETAKDLDEPSLGNGCVLRASLALTRNDPKLLADARSCLERTLELRPYDADAHAVLSVVLLASDPHHESEEVTRLASEHAEEAVALAPQSDRSYTARMMAAFRAGRMEAAKQAGEQAVSLNPYNPGAAARFSSVLFAMGDWDQAKVLARKASLIDDLQQPDAERTLAFDAYRRGAYEEAIARLRRIADGHCTLTQLLLAASLAQAGDEPEAIATLSALKDVRPDFEQTFQADMVSRQLNPALVDALGEGLRRAGSKVR